MTEKRFERVYGDVEVVCIDHQKTGDDKFFTDEDYDKFVECLNELHEDNHRLTHTLQKKEELLREVLKTNDNLTKKIRELEEDNFELKESMKRMMGDLMSR